jgi:hypothetical protein
LGDAEGKDRAIAQLAPVLASLRPSVLLDELTRRAAGALELAEGRLVELLAAGATPAGASSRDRGLRAPDPGPARGLRAPDRGPARGLRAPDPGLARAPAVPRPDHGLRSERSFLAMCIAAPEAGASVLSSLDPDALLSSDVMRRAARHLTGHLEAPLSGLPREDDELSRTIADLVARAGRGGSVTSDELEHSRLLLELGLLDRQIAQARVEHRPGIRELARLRQQVRERLGAVTTKIEQI